MKTKRTIISCLAITAALAISSCSTSRQIAYKDDVYNNRQANTERPTVYQSPDYYYSDEEYNNQNNSSYYADEYSDEEYEDGYEELEYANRINRFYYAAPGFTYFDPFFDPWFGYPRYGLGWYSWNSWRWNAGWYGFGWSYPYYSFYWNWGYPYYYGSYWGYNSYYNYWGHPYYGYGYGPGYSHVVTRPTYHSTRSLNRGNYDTRLTVNNRRGTTSSNRATVSRSVN